MRSHKLLSALAITAVTLCSTGILLSQTASPASEFKSIEYLVVGDATRGAGEPMIAVDPTNPQNMIVVVMGTLGELPPPPPGGRPGTQSIPRSTIPSMAVTHDGGTTWEFGELPIMAGTTFTRCPDAIADVTKEGVFLAGCEPRETTGEQYGMSAFVASTDKGITWGPLVEIISSFSADRFAPGLNPVFRGASPWDRPYTYIDDSTNVIYGVAFGGQAYSDTDPEQTRSQSYITASTDGGRSFGTIYSFDSKEYPQTSRGMGATAANGTVAVMYVAGSAPASENATCPCYVFGLSRDQGKTFSYHVIKGYTPPPSGGGRGGAPVAAPPAAPPAAAQAGGPVLGDTSGAGGGVITADPTTPGRFALRMSVPGNPPQYRVSVSEDYGQTWSTPVVAGSTPGAVRYFKSAFEYSRDGVLGLMWRAGYEDGSYDVWCSISRDGGKTFSSSVRVSHAKSPGSLPIKGTGNDDISDLSMDSENIHMVWGDLRPGFIGTFYGRVPFSAFEYPSQ